MIFINIPPHANQGETYDKPMHFEKPNKDLALASAFLLGIADAGIMNVIYTTVPIIWSDKSLSAYGLCQEYFHQSSVSAVLHLQQIRLIKMQDISNDRSCNQFWNCCVNIIMGTYGYYDWNRIFCINLLFFPQEPV